ncbi:hypothetical protein HPB50_012566 [Hyalomma asiaticum]|uniref:Uncharacterized protein n=1 Tax=Hyalomma asiaticum TaxID=266040 RepID=A0ACB7RID6_HYAAI|nr:hypothetical protein HPB50_012566 [Hyalomma asiaticum]
MAPILDAVLNDSAQQRRPQSCREVNYLSTLVTGAGAAAISGLQATEECYKGAIDNLKKRFGDEKIIVQEHLRSLLEAPPNFETSTTKYKYIRTIDLVLKYHELHKPMTTAVSTMQAQRDPEDRTTKIEKELQDLSEFLEHQLHCKETLAAYASPRRPEIRKQTGEISRRVGHRTMSSAASLQSVLAYSVIFDGGSQRSFITIEASRQLGCQVLKEETVTVGVFGGHKMQKPMRRIRVSIFEEATKKPIIVDALEAEDICSEHIPIPSEEVTKKMEEIGLDT